MSGREVPDLPADGLLLTPWREDDAAAVLELADDDVTRAWSPSLRTVRTGADALAWISGRRGDDRVDWAVRDPSSGLLVGRVGLYRFDPDGHSAEIGYGAHPAHRRRGVARRAVGTATAYGVTALHLHRVSLIHATGNLASCAVATSAGFAYEGVERSALDHGDGVLHDVHRHARLATDPPGPADPAPAPLEVPSLPGDGIRLRPWSERDGADYLRGAGDPSSARWSPHTPPSTAADVRRLFERARRRALAGESIGWAVEADGVLAGSVALRSINRIDCWATASYWTLPEARGRGVAPRALGVARAHAFDGLGLHRVQLQHAVANTASCRVAVKAGFALEGTQTGSCLLAGGFVDEHLHASVRDR